MTEKVQSAFKTEISKSRLEFLFDGVFAIAMTILVLELKLPELADKRSVHELGQALLHHWRHLPRLYHQLHHSERLLDRPQHAVCQIDAGHQGGRGHSRLAVWPGSAFIPFCAHLIGRYPGNPLALLVYLGDGLRLCLGLLTLVIAAEKQKLFDPAIPAERRDEAAPRLHPRGGRV